MLKMFFVCSTWAKWAAVLLHILFTRSPERVLFYLFLCSGSGAESSFRPWSLWTGSVALIAQVAVQMLESTVMPPRCAEGGEAERRREAGLRLCTVYQYFYLHHSLMSFDETCCFILPGPEICIKCNKLYRLCKMLNVCIAEKRSYSFRWKSDLKCIKEAKKQS